jgi:hypothetical protein
LTVGRSFSPHGGFAQPASISGALEGLRAAGAANLGAVQETVRAITAANLDAYESAVRAVTELEWMLARATVYEPISSLAAKSADATRDITAIQLSTARWILDL